MDSTISTLAAETKSTCLDIAGFQSRMSDLEQRVITVEDHLNTVPERDQELLFLRSKLIDLEDRSRRDNTNQCRKTFLSLRPHLRQLEVKNELFEPARIWVTKNGQSKDFYNPEGLRLYLDDLSTTLMDLTTQNLPTDVTKDSLDALLPLISLEGRPPGGRETYQSGRDPARLSGPHDDRGKGLLAVAHYTQQMDRVNLALH
ncbi:hypothetical protein NDU88_004513 [Pleurodeles waltl]|uniref:Uncharacterized protein n=1 Tax=Pleurodeles waltl TaxID=8319 RepID=A0AAV7W569_PLEWA|nr:hypothetical protein NDU88_004513 [Pleurodeles waltl]